MGWSISSGVGLCACQVHNTFETRSMSITELFPRTSFDSLLSVYRLVTGCSGKLYFFPRILIKLPLLPAFGCKENVQPIEGTVHSYYIESLENLLQQRWIAVALKKTTFFKNTLYIISMASIYLSDGKKFFADTFTFISIIILINWFIYAYMI